MALREIKDRRGRALRDEPSLPTAEAPETLPADNSSQGDKATKSVRFAALKRHPFIAGLVLILLLALIVGGVIWWLNARNYVSTDDAFIDARTVQVSPQVTGIITAVPVTDNQFVDQGALLIKIDDSTYRAALQQAQAQLEQANASVANFEAQIAAQQAKISQAKTQVTQAQAALDFSRQEFERAQRLLKTGAGTKQQEQQTRSDLLQKEAAYASAQANQSAAEKQIAVLRAERDAAKAQVAAARSLINRAEIDLNRTTINAPEPGRITNLTAAVGNLAQPGQSLMTLVPRNVWVTANFKETDLTNMRAGQPAEIEIDAYPNKTFHGHVASIQAGSGTAFSLLPPENATGNYVKVVQRVPVKIVFDQLPDAYLGPGMSVVPTVKIR